MKHHKQLTFSHSLHALDVTFVYVTEM